MVLAPSTEARNAPSWHQAIVDLRPDPMSQIRMKLKIRMKLAANFLLKLGRSPHALSLVQHVEQYLASNCIVGSFEYHQVDVDQRG